VQAVPTSDEQTQRRTLYVDVKYSTIAAMPLNRQPRRVHMRLELEGLLHKQGYDRLKLYNPVRTL